jgi:hypothetical protein
MQKHASTFPRNGAMQKGYDQEKRQHGGIAASLTTSKLIGCVSHAKCQEPTTRHQL